MRSKTCRFCVGEEIPDTVKNGDTVKHVFARTFRGSASRILVHPVLSISVGDCQPRHTRNGGLERRRNLLWLGPATKSKVLAQKKTLGMTIGSTAGRLANAASALIISLSLSFIIFNHSLSKTYDRPDLNSLAPARILTGPL
jgi:hypothetical protein